jgi:hypothetical protein
MRARRAGHILNVTSIGGKVSVAHLLPYSTAKFAAVGFSEGLHAELAPAGIHVLTVVPGLMGTGSHINAEFKGQYRREFAWFSLAASVPVTSMSAHKAARQIVAAIEYGDAELVLTWQAANREPIARPAVRRHGPGSRRRRPSAADRQRRRSAHGASGLGESRAISDSALTTFDERAGLRAGWGRHQRSARRRRSQPALSDTGARSPRGVRTPQCGLPRPSSPAPTSRTQRSGAHWSLAGRSRRS